MEVADAGHWLSFQEAHQFPDAMVSWEGNPIAERHLERLIAGVLKIHLIPE